MRGQQCRGYSDGGIRLGAEGYLFPQRESEVDSRVGRDDRAGWSRRDAGDDNANYQTAENTVEEMPTSQQDLEGAWEHAEVLQENEAISSPLTTAPVQDEYEIDAIRDDSLLKIDYKAELSGALLRAETDLVFRCLFAAQHANDLDYIRAIPATTFSEIIRLAEPRRFVSKLGSAHLELSTAMAKAMKIAPMRDVAFEYTSVIRHMLGIRKSAGIRLTLGDYTLLLRAARDLGNQRMGRLLWKNMLQEGYKPNTQCYNYMMSTTVWNGVHLAGSRQKVRIVPFNMLGRRKQTLKRFQNYRVGPSGVRETALGIFNEMLANEAYADQTSFCILMTASAREGDLKTVKSILTKVWNIDVDGIMAGKAEESILPRQRPDHSPLRPTADLLFTLAHIFAINNDIPTALRVVDFVARHYDLQLDGRTWSQLFEWTFVLAMDRLVATRRRGTDIGHLPAESLLNLWDTMTSPPYNFKPTMGMYNHMIKHLFRHRSLPEGMLEKMNAARRLYRKHRNAAHSAYAQLKAAVQRQTSEEHPHPLPIPLEKLRNQYEYADLIRKRDFFWLKRWLRLYLGAYTHYHRNDHSMDGTVRSLPRLLFLWRHEAPSRVRYETQTGLVELEFRTEEQILDSGKSKSAIRLEEQGVMDAASKLVGQTWVRGDVRKTRRLQKHELEEQLGADFFTSAR